MYRKQLWRPRIFKVSALLILAFLPLLSHAWWDDKCSEDGQCASMFKSYESLIRGVGCRSFYYTGKCSRICTYSLKSLIGRPTWAKCAEHCDWPEAITSSISSWLEMCLANPAPDVFESDDSESPQNPSDSRDSGLKKGSEPQTESKRKRFKLFEFSFFHILVFACFVTSCALMYISGPRKEELFQRMVKGMRFIKNRLMKSPRRKTPGRGPLDNAPDRRELRDLQRGARRHLKALRATID